MRCIAHIDVDAFLASVEQALQPELRGKPVVVGGMPDSRNLVMSCSYEARAHGVRPGMRSAEAARLCPGAIFRDGDSQAAGRLREQVARILYRYSPRIEIASIDDFFVDLTGCERLIQSPTSRQPLGTGSGAGRAACQEILRAVRTEVGLPLSIGIGTNRTIARIAGKLAKPAVRSTPTTNPSIDDIGAGLAEILPGYERTFLEHLPVEHLPGVGHRTKYLLERFAIRTIGELARVPREVLYASFGTAGLVLHERAHGIDPTPVEMGVSLRDGELEPHAPKSIRRDSTFEPEEGRREIVEAMLAYLVERAAQRLRRFELAAGSVQVRLTYVDTRQAHLRNADQGAFRASTVKGTLTLERASDSTDELWRISRALLRKLPKRRALVKRVGLSLIRLHAACGWQHHLFDEADGAQRQRPCSDVEGGHSDGPHPRHPASETGRSALCTSTSSRHEGGHHAPSSGRQETRADRQRRIDESLDLLRAKHGFGRILRGSSLPLRDVLPHGRDGYKLRTPSLNQ